jgi:hypothetical protein
MEDPYDVFDSVVLIFEPSGVASRLVEECGATLLRLKGAGTSVLAPLVGSFPRRPGRATAWGSPASPRAVSGAPHRARPPRCPAAAMARSRRVLDRTSRRASRHRTSL